ncbi:MAG: gliding motility-associated C-terminal domain-containing protein [Bacteroidales bacterium]|nr:gliding motility-associated C-terminal domain-containing protein [Bacteroidales bacterium]
MKILLTILISIVVVSSSMAQSDTTVTHHAPFFSHGQSLWQADTGSVFAIDYPFFDISWDESTSFGSITTVAGFDFGAEFEASTWGAMGSGLRIRFGSEKVDLDYTVDIDLEMPATGQFEKGEEITIITDFTPDPANCQMVVDTYNIVFQIWAAMGFGFEIGGEFCFFGCTDATIIDIDMPVDTFDIVYLSNTTGLSLLNGMYEWPVGDYFPFTWSDADEIITLMITLPNNSNATSYLVGDNLVSRTPPFEYAEVFFNIAKFIGALGIPYVSAFFANLENEWEFGPITLGYSLMHTGFEIGLYHNQKLTFKPDIKTTMDFPGIIDYKVLSPSNAVLAQGSDSTVTFSVGNKLRFDYPCNYEFMDIDPFYYMRNTFNNHTYDSIAFDFVFEMLEFNISMDDVEVIPRICIPTYYPCGPWYCVVCDWCRGSDFCTPAVVFHGFDYSYGPLVQLQPNIANIKYNWVNKTWEMKNFNNINPPSFRIRPAKYFVTTVPTASPCYGANGGSITATVSHGTPPYRYEWSNGVVHNTSSHTDVINGLSAGTHYVIVTDANGCVTFSEAIITEPAAALAINASTTDVDCNGNSTGAISVSTEGGTTPYSWSWSNGASSESLSNIPQGSYTLTVTDHNLCTYIESFTINEPFDLVSVASQGDVDCFGENTGFAEVSVSGGTLPYSYLWSNGGTNAIIDSLSSGAYTVTVEDAHGCQDILNYNILQPLAPLALTATSIDAYCNGEASGSIQIGASGGTSPYEFTWLYNSQSINEHSSQLDSIQAGTYIVLVSDDHGCTHDTTILIDEPASLIWSASTIDNLCYGQSLGSISLTVNGGTGPYIFNWSNGAVTQDINTLPAGNYTVTITDNNGCQQIGSVDIYEPGAPLTASIEPDHIKCFGDSTGMAWMNTNGGTPTYTYLWSNGATTENLSYVVAGTYTVTITDNNGCEAYSGTVINQPADSLSLILTVTDPSCYGYSDAILNVQANGGTTPYYIRWDDTDYLMQNNGHEVDQLESGNYQLIVTDANSCENIRNIFIDQPDSISVVGDITITSCYGGNDGSIELFVGGGTSPYIYNWSSGDNTEDVNGLNSGDYFVSVTDDHGCETVEHYYVGSMPQIEINSNVIPVSCSDNSDGSIYVIITGGAGNYNYNWSNGSDSSFVGDLEPGTYILTVTDNNGCQLTNDYILPESLNDCIFIPSSFTPNGDGTNDTWVINNIDLYPGNMVKIFNRWGTLLYEGNPYTDPWDGSYKGSQVPSETYYYVVDLNNGQEAFTGTVTIIR